MFSTYRAEDVTILLKDISGMVEPLPTAERERLIQSGVHYSAMLPIEYEPTAKYVEVYEDSLRRFALLTAAAVANVAEAVLAVRGDGIVLVSLARAGTSIGVLIKRYLWEKYRLIVPHYTVSIIRGIGIDKNAVNYILRRHAARYIQFVDGWTGKGAIKKQLNAAMNDYPELAPNLAVLSDPSGVADFCGTREDFLIASSCLNATVSGLLSRTFWRGDIIGEHDFHGAAFYSELKARDMTYGFIETVAANFAECADETTRKNILAASAHDGKVANCESCSESERGGLTEVKKICREFGVDDINLVKPGIGETTRVLLRRVPRCVLVHSTDDFVRLGHIFRLAEEKNVPIVPYPLNNYCACGIIAKLGDN